MPSGSWQTCLLRAQNVGLGLVDGYFSRLHSPALSHMRLPPLYSVISLMLLFYRKHLSVCCFFPKSFFFFLPFDCSVHWSFMELKSQQCQCVSKNTSSVRSFFILNLAHTPEHDFVTLGVLWRFAFFVCVTIQWKFTSSLALILHINIVKLSQMYL